MPQNIGILFDIEFFPIIMKSFLSASSKTLITQKGADKVGCIGRNLCR